MKKAKVKKEVKIVAEQPRPKVEGGRAGEGGDGTWISSLGGRKFVLVFLTMIGVVIVGSVRGDVTTEEIIDTLMWLAAIGAGSIAVEDGVGRAFARKG